MIKWTSAKRKIADIMPADYNPRRLTDEQAKNLTASLERFDLADPLIINADGKLIGGHQRLKILIKQGAVEVDVRVPDRQLTEAEEKELNLRLNRNLGEWNFELLAGFDEEMLKDVGFTSQEIDKIFSTEPDDKDDAVPEVKANPYKVKRGDIWKLGRHKLMCGDSTSQEDGTTLLAGAKAEMCFTDPPYNVDYQGGMNATGQNKRSGIKNDKMTKQAFYDFLLAVCKNIVGNVTGGIYICMSSSEMDQLRGAFRAGGGHWQDDIIWIKNTFTIGRSDYQRQYEPVLYGWPDGIKNHYFIDDRTMSDAWEDMRDIKTSFDGEYTSIKFAGFEVRVKGKAEGLVRKKKLETNIWRYDKPTKSEEHPTMKPVALCEKAILNLSKREGIVLDLFLGSGSTLIACEKTSRICYGMELDPHYCSVIIKRFEEFSGKKAVKCG